MSHQIAGNGSRPPAPDLAPGTRGDRASRLEPLEAPGRKESAATESVGPDQAPPPAAGLPRHRRWRLGLALAALAIVSGIAWAGHNWWIVGRYLETTDDAYVGGNVTAIAP